MEKTDMEETNLLLTQEFIAFSDKIKSIFEEKSSKKAELKAFFEKITAEIKGLDAKAKAAEDEFNAWKKSQSANQEAAPKTKS
jgi:hypothetical protein